MQIRRMQATFGKLDNQVLELSPGLNVLYAPNETGKSTWAAFLTSMLYGISTKNRGLLAEKNRYAPWSGKPMQGRMEFESGGREYTLQRSTLRANAPMGDFSCTYAGTATEVEGIDKGNCGETLLGVGREVFERSALVRQSGLAVDQDAELEKRIASLITTGEEDTSFSQTYQRLKNHLNSRKHNKTGEIPALERRLEELNAALDTAQQLRAQERACSEELKAATDGRAALEKQRALWQQAEQYEKAEAYRACEAQVQQCLTREALLAERTAGLPDGELLEQYAGQLRALRETAAALKAAQETAAEKDAEAGRAKAALDALGQAPEVKTPSPLLAVLGGVAGLAALIVFYLLHQLPIGIACCAVLVGVSLGAYLLKKKNCRAALLAAQQQSEVRGAAQAAYETARAELMHADAAADALAQTYQSGVTAVLRCVQTFQPSAVDPGGAQVALDTARQLLKEQDDARAKTREARLRLELLPQATAAAPTETPTLTQEEVRDRLAHSTDAIAALQSRLDTLRGRLHAAGNPADLEDERRQTEERLAAAQQEYAALALAMEALSAANTVLQNRFSPQLGEEAAEIFAGLTGGKYNKVLLSRDFSLSAQTADDPTRRDIQLLSQGAADQLYLAVRLAICKMVLPAEQCVPLILDDALLSFDEARCRAALDYLAQEGQKRQILLFTCQKREGDYLKERATTQTLH